MELFLLLSALIASLTGTARQAIAPAPGMRAERIVAAPALGLPAVVRGALVLARSAVPDPRPDGYVALEPMMLTGARPIEPLHARAERRRE